MTDTAVVTQALEYAARGWPVFPLTSKTKVPLTKEWPERATIDPAVIHATWDKHPGIGIGIVTGERSGIVVVDLDIKHGEKGPTNWDQYLSDNGIILSDTLRVKTQSGGEHRYYSIPDGSDYRDSNGILPGVDIRGTGGFVVAPGTKGYEFLTEMELQELPVGTLPEKAAKASEVYERHAPEYAFAAFNGGMDDLMNASEGERNSTLNRVAFKAAQEGLDKASVKGLLLDRGHKIGLTDSEIRKTIESAFSKISQDPDSTNESPTLKSNSTYDLIWDETVKPLIWGPIETPLWMPGESLMIAGESGLGKSTLAQSIVAARIGLLDEVLGYPVADNGGRVLYLALDRPAQILRMMRRLFPRDTDRDYLNDRLVIHRGPLPVDILKERYEEWLREQAQALGVTTIVIDSIKDVLLKPSDEGLAGAYNRVRQILVTAEIELVEIHHTRKSTLQGQGGQGAGDDIYGSQVIRSGAGSVLTLSRLKDASDDCAEVNLRQVKSLAGTFSGMMLTRDGEAGLFRPTDLTETLGSRISGLFLLNPDGLKPSEVYSHIYPEGASTSQQSEIRRALRHLVKVGELVRDDKGQYTAS
jgi:hypothetical protein